MSVRSVIYLLISAVSNDVYVNNEPFILIDIEAPLETIFSTKKEKKIKTTQPLKHPWL